MKQRPPNILADEALNRFSFRRDNQQWIDQQLKSENSRFYPVVSDKLAIRTIKGEPRLACLPTELALNQINAGSLTIYLGTDDNCSYFALEFHEHIEIPEASFGDLRSLATLLPAQEAGMFAYARAMMHWHRTHRYCGNCGHETQIRQSGHQRACSNASCDTDSLFPRTDAAVIVLVEKDGRCLLGRQAQWTNNTFSTLAGFVEPGESLEQAVVREVYEESGVNVTNVHYHSSQPWPFPASIMLGFSATATSSTIELIDGELVEARWFSRDDIIHNLRDGGMGLPSRLSIAYRLVKDWFLEDSNYSLADIQ